MDTTTLCMAGRKSVMLHATKDGRRTLCGQEAHQGRRIREASRTNMHLLECRSCYAKLAK